MRAKRRKRRYVTYGAQAKKEPRLSMGFIAKWLVLAVVLVGTAVAYVWQKNTMISLGYRIDRVQKVIRASEEEERKLQVELVRLQRPERLWQEVKERGLGLERESPNQVMRLLTPRPFGLLPAKGNPTHYPPAVPEKVAKLSDPAPHPGSAVSRPRR